MPVPLPAVQHEAQGLVHAVVPHQLHAHQRHEVAEGLGRPALLVLHQAAVLHAVALHVVVQDLRLLHGAEPVLRRVRIEVVGLSQHPLQRVHGRLVAHGGHHVRDVALLGQLRVALGQVHDAHALRPAVQRQGHVPGVLLAGAALLRVLLVLRVVVRQDHHVRADQPGRVPLAPLARAARVAGGGVAQAREGLHVLLALHQVHGAPVPDGPRQLRQPVQRGVPDALRYRPHPSGRVGLRILRRVPALAEGLHPLALVLGLEPAHLEDLGPVLVRVAVDLRRPVEVIPWTIGLLRAFPRSRGALIARGTVLWTVSSEARAVRPRRVARRSLVG